jgi:ferric-dicitrate binding protein FerR (iron transport regulator)
MAWWLLGKTDADLMAEIDTHIHPGHDQAVLVLSDGSSIELDPSLDMERMEEGNATIRKADRGIHYESISGGQVQKPAVYNRLITPRGGSYMLSLADGSRVWLNAGSSLRFPVSFQDSSRQVYLEGEAYFEVRPGDKPFIVSSGKMHTQVLGTSFNVSAYGDEAFLRTTLVEGKVLVSWKVEGEADSQAAVLEPDQQASLDRGEEKLSVTHVDASGYTSWVSGRMEFHQESLAQVMKRLSRWYDFEFEFENEAARDLSFSARLDRSSQISEILDMLALTTDVKFEFRGDRIVIQ